jgi:DNA-binding response OmpR family regulator
MNNILLVEDDIELDSIITMYLESLGFNLFNAPDGDKALKLLDELLNKKIYLDLLITDLNLPLIGGLKLIEVIQKRQISLKYLVISAFVTESTENRLQELGCSNILEKPFSPEILLEKINSIL